MSAATYVLPSVSELRRKFEERRSLQRSTSESSLNVARRDNELQPLSFSEDLTLTYANINETHGKSHTLPKPPMPAPRRVKLPDKEPMNYQNLGECSFYQAGRAEDVEELRNQCVNVMDKSIREMKSEGFIDKESLVHYESDSSSDTSYLKAVEDSDDSTLYENVDDAAFRLREFKMRRPASSASGSSRSSEFATPKTGRNENEAPKLRPRVVNAVKPSPRAPPEDLYETASQNNSDITQKVLKIIQHLKTTEKRHLQELIEVVPVFTYVVKHHSSISVKSKADRICATVERLLEIQTEFGANLGEADHISDVLRGFIHYEELFFTYRQFFTDNTILTITIADEKNDYKGEITLRAILSQRLVHYRMFLEEIKTELAGHPDFLQVVACPLNNVTEILDSCNKILLLEKLQNNPLRTNEFGSLDDLRKAPTSLLVQSCPFDVTGYGDYLLKDKFNMSKPRKIAATVFLFNNIMIFTKEDANETFYYRSHVKMTEIVPLTEGKKKKVLKFSHAVTPNEFCVYKLEAASKSIATTWRKKIQEVLWTQNLKIREEVHRKYNRSSSQVSAPPF